MNEAALTDPAVHVDAAHAEEIKKHVRVYLIVFGALAVLTVVTVAVAYLNLPIVAAVIVALIIASVKAGLVAAYFMHLVSEKKVIYWTLGLTAAFLAAMFIIFIAAYYDQDGNPDAEAVPRILDVELFEPEWEGRFVA